MKKKFKTTLFVFRRDLRIEDNIGLLFALQQSERVIAAFIFTPEQIENNPYRSDFCLQFMIESLQDLQGQLKNKGGHLYFFEGKNEEVLETCLKKLKIEAVVVNRDYTPYSIQRDKRIEKICKAKGVTFHSFDDALLNPPEETLKKDGKPYTIFTPYFRNASKIEVVKPVPNRETNYFSGPIPFAKKNVPLQLKTHGRIKGGREEGLKVLKKLGSFKAYSKQRDFPAEDSTHLSPYLKFNVCSIREVYAAVCHSLGSHHELIRSLYWRDFFTAIGFFFPHVFKGSFHPKYDRIKWSYDKKVFHKWCQGVTGVPIVDAGMRELNETGFMHNRVRMIAASFLVKDLHIDWRWGEKHFAQTLIDYDPAVNNGNWQWIASTGCDAQPYFRIFNPWNQQKKFDRECIYIKKWVAELRTLSPKTIHGWGKTQDKIVDYPAPLVDHQREAKKALRMYR